MRPGVLPMTPETKRQSSEWVGETEIPKVPHQDHVDNFFDSHDEVHTEFAPEFYKRVMDRLLKRIQRVRPAAFCSRRFLLVAR